MGISVVEVEEQGFGIYSSIEDSFLRPFKNSCQEIFDEHTAYLLFYLLEENKWREHIVDDTIFTKFFDSLPTQIITALEEEDYVSLDFLTAEETGKWLYEIWPEYSPETDTETSTIGLTGEAILEKGKEVTGEVVRRGIPIAKKGVKKSIELGKKTPEYIKRITPAIKYKKILIKSEIITKNGKRVRLDYYKTVPVTGTAGLTLNKNWDPSIIKNVLDGNYLFGRITGDNCLLIALNNIYETAEYEEILKIKNNDLSPLKQWINKITGGM